MKLKEDILCLPLLVCTLAYNANVCVLSMEVDVTVDITVTQLACNVILHIGCRAVSCGCLTIMKT